ncbi:MAG TPA: inorganic phosphate transporter [Bacteroidales bacterium]|nr:inorganic phosphate transporter [Bacteroidales bacterium]HPS63166.1 inorganic phosphate transporter [Bacteroidales bacterium]
MFGLDPLYTWLLIACLLAACAFEFINGFHDTANAVATVIYTHSLKPTVAVIWSGFWNFLGVNIGGIAVAIGIVNLLPLEILVDQNLAHNIAMVLSLILTAILWNLATWYIGIPCSSSHTLIGSIFGVGLAFMLLPGSPSIALNWKKVTDIGLSLLVSPVFGFGLSLLLMYILQRVIKNKDIFKEPPSKKPPPAWIRSILILTCTSVSYAHGSNDGQKGVGLVMLILIGFAPTFFALDPGKSPALLLSDVKKVEWTVRKFDTVKMAEADRKDYRVVLSTLASMKTELAGIQSMEQLEKKDHFKVRKQILVLAKKTEGLMAQVGQAGHAGISKAQAAVLKAKLKEMRGSTEYAPRWVILMIAISLGLGTMIGWKRIVVTIGEKVGKTHLTYAQGASAELVAASTIWVSSSFGLPVSTTHVLTSGVAGTMFAGTGRRNLRMGTIKSILIAWVITLPVTIVVSGGMFYLLRILMK